MRGHEAELCVLTGLLYSMAAMDEILRSVPAGKKEREETLLDSLLARLRLKRPCIESRENPDFILTWDAEASLKLGVEITEFHWDSAEDGSRYRMARGTLRRIKDRLTHNVYVEISGDVANVCRLNSAAAAELNAIASRVVRDGPIVGRLSNGLEVRLILDHEPRVWWTGMRSGSVEEPAPRVRRILETKRRNRYEGHTELWLVICAIPVVLGSVGVVLSSDELGSLDVAPFQCALFWDAFSENIWRIGVAGTCIMCDGHQRLLHLNAYPPSVQPLIAG